MKWYIWTILIIIFFTLITIRARIKKRGYFWTDKKGNPVTFKQFKQKWRKGIEGITPLQQTKAQLLGTWITLTGIIAGMLVNVLVRLKNQWWWILIILSGSLILMLIQFLGTYQKYRIQKQIDIAMKEAMKQQEDNNDKPNGT
jgi:amino acid transporter